MQSSVLADSQERVVYSILKTVALIQPGVPQALASEGTIQAYRHPVLFERISSCLS